MSTQQYAPELKTEAIRQIVEHGYSVAEIAARLGVSTHSLYKWVSTVPLPRCAGIADRSCRVLSMAAQARP